jgi:hypothetical protein
VLATVVGRGQGVIQGSEVDVDSWQLGRICPCDRPFSRSHDGFA